MGDRKCLGEPRKSLVELPGAIQFLQISAGEFFNSLLNETVWTAVEKAVLSPSVIAEQVAKLNQSKADCTSRTQAVVDEVEQMALHIHKEEARLLEAYRMGILSPVQLRRELEQINLRKASLDARKTGLFQQIQTLSPPAIKKSIMDYCELAAQRLWSFGPEERQHFLRHLVREVVFNGGTVRIKGVIPVSVDGTRRDSGPEDESDEKVSGDIATTKMEGCGRNVTSVFQGLLPASEDRTTDAYFALVQPVPRPINSRLHLRQENRPRGMNSTGNLL